MGPHLQQVVQRARNLLIGLWTSPARERTLTADHDEQENMLEADFPETLQVPRPEFDRRRLCELLEGTRQLRDRMAAAERAAEQGIEDLHPDQQASARNLLHYLAMRREDLRPLQDELVRCGISSLGRCEAYVMANLRAVISVLTELAGEDADGDLQDQVPVDFENGRRLIEQRTRQLFGGVQRSRGVHIMVTMPSEAADNYPLGERSCRPRNGLHANQLRARRLGRLAEDDQQSAAGPKQNWIESAVYSWI